MFFSFFKAFKLINENEYLSGKVISTALSGLQIFLISLIVLSPPQIILQSEMEEICLVLSASSLFLYWIKVFDFFKSLNFFFENSFLIVDIIIFFSSKFFDGIFTIFELPLNKPIKKEYIKLVGTFEGQI